MEILLSSERREGTWYGFFQYFDNGRRTGAVSVRGDYIYATLRPGIQPARIKKFPGCPRKLQLHPQDIGPNSVSNICNFQVFYEVYLQEEPSVELFRDFFFI